MDGEGEESLEIKLIGIPGEGGIQKFLMRRDTGSKPV